MRPRASLSMAVIGLSLIATTAPAAAAGPRLSRTERAIVRRIDHKRRAHGLGSVRPSRALSRAADFHSHEMLADNYFAHSSGNGSSFMTRMRRFTHAKRLGEALALLHGCRYHPAQRVVWMWMHSAIHRAILLGHGFHHVGIGLRDGRLGGRHTCVVTADFSR